MAEKTYSQRLKPSGNSFKKAFAAAKAAGKGEFMWKGRDYTTETADERKADFKRETRREKYRRKELTGEGGGLSDFEGAFKTAKKQFGPHKVFKHKGKEFMSDVKGDKPRREGYDTMVMANKGGRVGLKRGSSSSPVQKSPDRKLVADLSVNDIRMIQKAKKHGLTTVTEIKETVGAGFNKKKPPTDKEIKGVLKETITKPTGIFKKASKGGRIGRQIGGELNRGYTHGGLIKGFPKLAKKGWS